MTDADKPRFLNAFIALAIAFREKERDTVVFHTYFHGLEDFAVELVVAAADQLVRGKWFPTVSEWRQDAQRIERERQEDQRARLRNLPEPLCAHCDDTGWIVEDTRARRCPCADQRRQELLGRAAAPALPTHQAAPNPDARARVRGIVAATVRTMPRLPRFDRQQLNDTESTD
jgi:hypothetical protein